MFEGLNAKIQTLFSHYFKKVHTFMPKSVYNYNRR